MSKRNPKPETAAAKAEAKLLADCKRAYPDFDADVIRFGTHVAIWNAAWLDGNEKARKRKK